MDIYDFLQLATDLSNVNFRIFDCESEEIVYEQFDVSTNDIPDNLLNLEVESFDLYTASGVLTMEVNVTIEDED